jgi:hypothetical protein
MMSYLDSLPANQQAYAQGLITSTQLALAKEDSEKQLQSFIGEDISTSTNKLSGILKI